MVERAYVQAGELFEKARTFSEKPVDRADGCIGLAILSEEAGALDRAASYYEEALRNRPGFPRALERFANLELFRKRPVRAAALLKELVAQKPDNPGVAAMYGRALAMAGRFDEARSALRRSLELEPEQPEVRSLLERLPAGSS
jgi:predicted Zn-dependent protease